MVTNSGNATLTVTLLGNRQRRMKRSIIGSEYKIFIL